MNLRIDRQLSETLGAHAGGMPAEARRARVRETLEEVALPGDDEFLRRHPHQLAGASSSRGDRHGVRRPHVIVCYEPTDGLDVTTQADDARIEVGMTYAACGAKGSSSGSPRTHRYELTSEGRRLAVFFSKTYTRIVNPALAELDPALPAEITNRSPIAKAWRAYEHQLNARIAEAALTT